MRAVLIAAKQLALAKTRLAPAFPAAAERSALAEAMFRDVLAAALGARLPVMVAVVTSDAALIALARAGGAIVIDEEYPRGLNVAVGLGTEFLIGRGATTVCTLLSDIPLVTGEDIDASFAAIAPGGAGVVLVPSVDLTGTNIMTRMPPDCDSDALRTHEPGAPCGRLPRAGGALRGGADGAPGDRYRCAAGLDRIRPDAQYDAYLRPAFPSGRDSRLKNLRCDANSQQD